MRCFRKLGKPEAGSGIVGDMLSESSIKTTPCVTYGCAGATATGSPGRARFGCSSTEAVGDAAAEPTSCSELGVEAGADCGADVGAGGGNGAGVTFGADATWGAAVTARGSSGGGAGGAGGAGG